MPIQQGRLYYEAATLSPLEIRPLLPFYGLTSFARVMTAALPGTHSATVPRSHGARDAPPRNATLPNLKVNVEGAGTFGGFNDAVARFNRIRLYDADSTPFVQACPAAMNSVLAGMTPRSR